MKLISRRSVETDKEEPIGIDVSAAFANSSETVEEVPTGIDVSAAFENSFETVEKEIREITFESLIRNPERK